MIDKYVRRRTLSINGKYSFKTVLGGLSSLILLIISSMITYFLGMDFLDKKAYINQNESDTNVAILEKWSLSLPFYYRFPKEFKNSIRLANNTGSGLIISKIHECNETEYSVFYSSPKDESFLHYCTDLNLLGETTIEIKHCKKLNYDDPSCDRNTTNEFVDVFAAIQFTKYNYADYYNPEVKTNYYFNNTKFWSYSTQGDIIHYTHDVGYFTNYYKEGSIFKLNSKVENTDARQNDPPYLFLMHNIYWDAYKYEQSFQKIPLTLAKIVGIVKIIYFFFLFINSIGFEYFILNFMLDNFCDENYVDYFYKKVIGKPEIEKSFKSEVQNLHTVSDNLTLLEKKKRIFQDFNFKNYIIYHYFFWICKSSKFKCIYAELKKLLSFEKTITKKPMLIDSSEKKSKLIKLDIFGNNKTFLIKNKRTFTTTLGFVLTICFILSIIPVYYIVGNDYFERTPIFNIRKMSMNEYGFNYKLDIPIMMTFHKEIADYIRFVIIEDVTRWDLRLFEPWECSDQEIESYYGEGVKRNKTNYYFCSNLNKVFLQVNELGGVDGYLWYAINCTDPNLLKLGQKIDDCPPPPKDPNLEVYTAYGTIAKTYNASNYAEPLKSFPSIMYKVTKAYDRWWYNKLFVRGSMTYDNNLFFADNMFDEFGIQKFEYYTGGTPEFYFFTYTRLSSNYDSITLKYKKFPEVIADSGPIIIIVNFIFYLLSYLYYDYFYDKQFYNSFLADDLTLASIKAEYEKYFKNFTGSYKLTVLDSYLQYLRNKKEGNYTNLNNLKSNTRTTKINCQPKDKTNTKMVGLAILKAFEINYKSYIKKLICCCGKRSVENSIIKESFMKYLSFEKLMKENFENRQLTDFSQISYRSPPFLSTFDLFSSSELLYIRNYRAFKTQFGGVLSIIYFVIVILLFYVLGQDFLQKKNAKFRYLNINLEADVTDKKKYDLNIPFVFGYSKELVSTTRILITTPNESTYNKLMECTESDLARFNITPNKTLEYKCIKLQDIMDRYYELNGNNGVFIDLVLCSKIFGDYSDGKWFNTIRPPKDQLCTIDPDPNGYYRIEYYFNVTRFYEDKASNFIVNEVEHRISEGNGIKIGAGHYEFKEKILYDDQNILVSQPTEHIFTSLDWFRYDKFNGIFLYRFSFNLYYYNIIFQVTRTYQKLPELVAQFFSIAGIFKIVLDFINSFISEYLFYKYLIKLYFSKYDTNYINSVINQKTLEIVNKNLKFDLTEEFLTRKFSITNYFRAVYMNCLFKTNADVKLCGLILNELQKMISLEEFVKSPYSEITHNNEIPSLRNLNNMNNENNNELLNINHSIRLKINYH